VVPAEVPVVPAEVPVVPVVPVVRERAGPVEPTVLDTVGSRPSRRPDGRWLWGAGCGALAVLLSPGALGGYGSFILARWNLQR
jgi:hypothetical protein